MFFLLIRTTTLNDVYQHYSPQRRMKVKTSVRPEDDFQDYDGEVTSYGVPMPVPSEKSKNHYAGIFFTVFLFFCFFYNFAILRQIFKFSYKVH